jgi:hypothetical protein
VHQQLDLTAVALAAALGIALPICIIFMRQSVKLQRQQLIKDLEDIFHRVPPSQGEDQVIPSFEFVKFKYFLPSDPQARQYVTQDISTFVLLGSSIPLVVCLLILGYISISTMLSMAIREYLPGYFSFDRPIQPWHAALTVAYVGGYLFVIRDLLCSVENFDLGPARMLASALHVLFGATTAILITVGWMLLFPGVEVRIVNISILITAFAVGYVPELGIRSLLRASKLRLFKREDVHVFKSFKSTPLEIIDGIDSEIRSRLREFNIATVQHLATANPVMLFVETPYGVYQIFDWVSQAQLCSAVGPRAFVDLSRIGIRTIFGLERAVLDARISTAAFRHEIGRIIIHGLDAGGQKKIGLSPGDVHTAESDRTVTAFVEVAIDDLHVQRLRQIFNCVADRLGRVITRLRFTGRGKRKNWLELERQLNPASRSAPPVEVSRDNAGVANVSAFPKAESVQERR